jgi:hypothetical protein
MAVSLLNGAVSRTSAVEPSPIGVKDSLPPEPKSAVSVLPFSSALADPPGLFDDQSRNLVIVVSVASMVIVCGMSPHGNVGIVPVQLPAKCLRGFGARADASDRFSAGDSVVLALTSDFAFLGLGVGVGSSEIGAGKYCAVKTNIAVVRPI